MIIRLFISTFIVLMLPGIIFAGVIKINLNTGLVRPGQTIIINLDELLPAHVYKLSCVLTSDHTAGKSFDIVQVTTPTNSTQVGITADEVTPGSHRYNIPTNKNTYLYGNITKDIGDISITNLDDTDAVLLSSCHAVGRV